MKKTSGLLLIGLAIAGSGCDVAPSYKQPVHNAPIAWDASHHASSVVPPNAPSRPTTEPVQPAWWDIFHDPILSDLERKMAHDNLDLRVAAYRLAESREQESITAADQFPQIDGTGSYDRVKLSPRGEFGLIGSGGSGGAEGSSSAASGLPTSSLGSLGSTISRPFNLWQYGFDANWELDLWGRVRNSIKQARSDVIASEEDRRNMLVSMLAETARDYMQLRNTQALLKIAQKNLKVAHESVDLAQQRMQGGLGTGLDLANAQAQLADTVAIVPQLEQQEAQQINALSFLLAEPPGALSATLEAPGAMPVIPPRIPIGLPSELTERRPDIREAEARLKGATAGIGVARANFFPSVVLSGNVTLQALRFSELGNWDSRSYTVGPNISLPIFEGGRLIARLKLSKEQEKEAALRYQRTVLNAFHEVDNALVAYHAEQQRRDQLLIVGAQDRTAMQLARQRYAGGLATFLDVLNAQRQLLSADQSLQNSNATICTDIVQLYLALGGGWNADFDDNASR